MRADTLWLVSPIYYDVESYRRLRDDARAALAGTPDVTLRFVAVDDTAEIGRAHV